VNTAYMVSVFVGQLIGTAVGNDLYARGGWIASGSASVGFVSAALVVCFLRGPHETGWVGWRGGYNMRKTPMSKPAGNERDQEAGQTGAPSVSAMAEPSGETQREKPLDVKIQEGGPEITDSSRTSQRTLREEIASKGEKA